MKPTITGHQRRCEHSRRECCRGHQYCLQHRDDTQDRSRLLSLGRRSSRIVGVCSRTIQPYRHYDPCTHFKSASVENKWFTRGPWVIIELTVGVAGEWRIGRLVSISRDVGRVNAGAATFTLPSWTAARGQRASPRLLRSRAPLSRQFDR
jgi:hypothetical protein